MDDDPSDDPVLARYAGIGALAEAREQLGALSKEDRAKLKHELIDQHVSMAMHDGRTRKQAISFARECFRVSERTVETALAFMKGRREAEEAHAKFVRTRPEEARKRAIAAAITATRRR
jgi:phage I-like protein